MKEYGDRYILDFECVDGDRRATIRSGWTVRRWRKLPEADDMLCTIRVRCAMAELEMLSVVALVEDLPEKGLRRGQVGTIVEDLASGVYEVEFSDDAGGTYATVALTRPR
jgi:hypothetical protein